MRIIQGYIGWMVFQVENGEAKLLSMRLFLADSSFCSWFCQASSGCTAGR